ncbi:hypothetical protein ACJIZ3_022170 [Penstemon smallii]|uniref:Uncharacterized protein n=1 Tax=Penstemon smallii TaxID=265156 RepID=A0ABD3SP48_9LAMI
MLYRSLQEIGVLFSYFVKKKSIQLLVPLLQNARDTIINIPVAYPKPTMKCQSKSLLLELGAKFLVGFSESQLVFNGNSHSPVTRTFKLDEFFNIHGNPSLILLYPMFNTSNNWQLAKDVGIFSSILFRLRSKVFRPQLTENELVVEFSIPPLMDSLSSSKLVTCPEISQATPSQLQESFVTFWFQFTSLVEKEAPLSFASRSRIVHDNIPKTSGRKPFGKQIPRKPLPLPIGITSFPIFIIIMCILVF